MRRLGLAAILAATAAGAAWADQAGTTAADFLKIGPDARGLAMGSAASAVSDDAYAVYWNPAGLAWSKNHEVAASYSSLFQDENQGFLAVMGPLDGGLGRWALSADYLWISNIQKRAGDTDTADSTFSDQNWAIAATWADTFHERYAFGVTLKEIKESFDTFSSNSAAVDLGVRYGRPTDPWSAGLSLSNLGLNMAGDPLPILLKGGVALRPAKELTLAADVDDWAQDQLTYLDLGGEYVLMRSLSLRAGYQFGRSSANLGGATGLSAGLGVRFSSLNLSYAFLPFGDLGNTHRISLDFSF